MIFLSYRRGDTAGHAGRLFDRLAHQFGRNHVFMDVDTIRPGEDFIHAIDQRIRDCTILIALIGDDWIEASDSKGRRLDDPQDFVRLEIAAALERGIPVIPVLVEGAAMPRADQLPAALHPLLRFQAFEIRDTRFDSEAQDLVRAIERHWTPPTAEADSKARQRRGLGLRIATGLGFIALGIATMVFFRDRQPPDPTGRWRADITNARGHKYQIALDLRAEGKLLFGTVSYPTGVGSIEQGSVEGARLSFTTRHVPQFAEEPALIRFGGEVRKDQLRLTMQSDGSVEQVYAVRAP